MQPPNRIRVLGEGEYRRNGDTHLGTGGLVDGGPRAAPLPALPQRRAPGRRRLRLRRLWRESLPIRDGVLIVRDTATEDNKIAADFYNSKLWPKVRFWEQIFWVLNGGEKRAREAVLRRLPRSRGLRLLDDVAIGDGFTRAGFPKTGRSSASTFPQPSLPPASAETPAAISGSFSAKPRTCRSATRSSTRC
jgi:hypothetical protein